MMKRLNNGIDMPIIGLGVWQTQDGEEAVNAVRWALETGYRLIDTASAYRNEESVGKGIKTSGVAREDIFVTTKVWNDEQRQHEQRQAFEKSLRLLDLEYVDLYLVHWPVKDIYKETWKILEQLYAEKLVRAIGVSNFQPHHLKDLLADAAIPPAVNQVEINPWMNQEPLVAFCDELGIAVEGWRPLGGANGKLLEEPALTAIASRLAKTPAQVVIRWNIQRGVIVIPKSSKKERIAANFKVFDFTLPADDMAVINGLNRNRRSGPDPDNFSF